MLPVPPVPPGPQHGWDGAKATHCRETIAHIEPSHGNKRLGWVLKAMDYVFFKEKMPFSNEWLNFPMNV